MAWLAWPVQFLLPGLSGVIPPTRSAVANTVSDHYTYRINVVG